MTIERVRQSRSKLDKQICEQARMETFLAPKRKAYVDPPIDRDQGNFNENEHEVEKEDICYTCKQIDPPATELDNEDIDDDTIGWVSCDNCFKHFL